MNQKVSRLAFVICCVVFAAVLAVSLLLPGGGRDEGPPVQISEVLASNRTYPAPNGAYYDFIEVQNSSDSAMDLSGWQLSDRLDAMGYTFPRGTVLQPGEAALCWTSGEAEDEAYGSFGISAKGKDTLFLYNSANVQVQQLSIPALPENHAYALQPDGSWEITAMVTPGFSNDEEGYRGFLALHDGGSCMISEIMTANDLIVLPQGRTGDWVELHNPGDTPLDLTGAWLSDDPAEPLQWQLPAMTLDPGGYVLIPCAGKDAREGEAPFGLSKAGCTVVLTGPLGNLLSMVPCPALDRGSSWALLEDGSYDVSAAPTPGFSNDAAGLEAWTASLGEAEPVVISEVMTANRSYAAPGGRFCDWIELQNTGKKAVNLAGCWLSDDPGQPGLWQLPDVPLEPGGCAVIYCAGAQAQAGEAPFSLSKTGCTLLLTGAAGQPLARLEVPPLEPDRSWALQPDGSYEETAQCSPGFSNDEAGRQAALSAAPWDGPLQISEAMASNDWYLRQNDGRFYDWVELLNVSTGPVELSDYALSSRRDEPLQFVLPEQVLQPGERILILCSSDPIESPTQIQAPFSLGRTESWVYVSTKDGLCVDCLHLLSTPLGCSAGRPDGQWTTAFFDTPTPGAANGAGLLYQCPQPELLTADGIYDDVSQVEVRLSAPHTIHYTLDGSLPTPSDPVYADPLVLTETTVLRAAAFSADGIPSAPLTAAYILNEHHTLPVLCLSASPAKLLGEDGIYKNYEENWEIPCNLTLYENGRAFSIDCGVKMHGHTGLQNPKKSFKVNFRSQYGPGTLDFPVYGPNAPASYDSLCIRSGQDYPSSIFRDELFTTLCRQLGDNVLAQRDKFCILYINGQYWGIYCLKEAFSEAFYADNRHVPVESVTMAQAPARYQSEMFNLIQYCKTNDLTQDEHYQYIADRIDVSSLIDWMIMEGYSCNGDVQQNLRYFKDDSRGWQMAFYDLDWAFYYHNPMTHVLSDKKDWQHMPLTIGMMQNPRFRQAFLQRLSEALAGPLSNENVLSVIDSYAALLDPEVPRERDRWISSYDAWLGQVETLRRFVRNNHIPDIIDSLRGFIGLTAEEEETYFGRWIS